MASKTPHPWEKIARESPEWFAKFHIYLILGPGRSVLKAYKEYLRHHNRRIPKQLHKSGASIPGAWAGKVKEFRWKERARAYDQKNRTADERLTRRLRQKKIKLTDAFWDKARFIAGMPVVRRISEDGKTIIEPLPDATLRTAIDLGQAASRMGDEVLGKDRADVEVNVNKTSSLDDDLEYLKQLKELSESPPPKPDSKIGRASCRERV